MKPRKLIYGVGINDADYVVKKMEATGYVNGKRKRKMVWVCPYYQTWADMLRRCYSTKYQEKYPTYKGCSVLDSWLKFTNFKNWMMTQDWEDKCLDKDLLFVGNKVYSPETCVFISNMVNTFTTECRAAREECLVGVSWHKPTGKFRAQCSNPFSGEREYLGLFTCEQEAHEVWLKRKLELADELSSIQEDSRVAEALINRYSNYRTNRR